MNNINERKICKCQGLILVDTSKIFVLYLGNIFEAFNFNNNENRGYGDEFGADMYSQTRNMFDFLLD